MFLLCWFVGAFAAASLSKEEVFIRWFNAKGGKNEGVILHDFENMGRGVLAQDDIFIGEQVLFIPSEILLARDMLLKSNDPIHRRIGLAFTGSEPAVVAVLLLEVARGEKSVWKPYLDLLPRYVPNLSHFAPQLLQELDDYDIKTDALTHQHEITNAYATFINQASAFWPVEMAVSLEQYRWATSIIDSRGLRFKGQVVLAPFADMFNYAPNNVPREQNMGSFFLQHHQLGAAGLSITADHDCARGAQLLEDYGDNSDSIYISYHGFVPDINPFRCVSVVLPDVISLGRRARELLELLQFKKAPAACAAVPLTAPAATTEDPKARPRSVFNPGFVGYATAMTMNRTELGVCREAVAAGSADKSAYWKRVFQACGFDASGALWDGLLGRGSAPAVNSLDPTALPARTVVTMHQLLVSGMQKRHGSSVAAEDTAEQLIALRALHAADQELLQDVQAALDREYTALSSPLVDAESGTDTVNRTLMHHELSVKYRVAMQREWLQLIAAFDLPARGLLQGGAHGEDVTVTEDELVLNKSTVVEVTPTHTITTTTVTTQKVELASELSRQLAAFNEWVQAASPSVLKIAAVELPLPYRVGTIATADIRAEEVYLTIPTAIIIDNEKARADGDVGPLLRALEARFRGKDDFHELLLFLVYHKFVLGPDSPFYPYLRLLPALHQLGSPVLWSEEDIRGRLGPSHTVQTAAEERRRTLKTFEMVSGIDLISRFFMQQQTNREMDTDYLSLDNYQWVSASTDTAGEASLLNSNCVLFPPFPTTVGIGCSQLAGDLVGWTATPGAAARLY